MKKFFLTAAAGLAIVAAGSLTAPRADAMPLGLPAGALDQIDVIEQVALCFYIDGWNGPGMYQCGYRHRRGMGWHGRRDGGGSGVHRGRSGPQRSGRSSGKKKRN